MKIVLKNLTGLNFKGLRSFSFELDPDSTDFKGYNKTGKTTLMDAFLWLFFGKDSTDRKDFEIKTLDENNKPYHRLDHEVSAVIDVDGENITLRRVYKEKWTKPRGTNQEVFSGHTADFYWNDVPMKESEYQAKVSSIINENIFKLITNTSYFNSLKWQERRNALLQIAGTISNDDIFSSLSGDFTELKKALNAKKSVDEFKKEINAKKKKIADEKETIPVRISEADRSLPEQLDYTSIEAKILNLSNELTNIDRQLMDKTQEEKQRQDAIVIKMKEVGTMRSQLQQIEFGERNAIQEKKRLREKNIMDKRSLLRNKEDEASRMRVDYSTEEKRKSGLELIATDLRQKWENINKEELKFNDGDFCCPTCRRTYEAEDVEAKKNEMRANFNTDKSRRLANITEQGSKIKDDINTIIAKLDNIAANGKTLRAEIEVMKSDIQTLEEEHSRLSANEEVEMKNAIENNTEYKGIQEMISLRTEEIDSPAQTVDNSAIIQRKKEISLALDGLKTQKATKEQREKIRIQAGLDIINVFCEHYNVYAPVWIDNRESVIDLPQTNSQLINLFVSEAHQKLTLVRKKELAVA
jgi:exonuclease SbcC